MVDPAPERSPGTRGERWTSGLFLFAILALIGADMAVNYAPAKLGGLFILLFWIPLLVTHEAGHAVAARLLGWHVGRVVLGFGKTLKSIQVGTARIDLRPLPLSGFVSSVPTHLRQPRLRNALIYFAGPGADLLVAALVVLFVGYERLLTPTRDVGMIALQGLALAGVSQGIINLIPYSTTLGKREIPNDGLGILLSPRIPDSYFAEQINAFRKQGAAYFEDEPAKPKDNPDEWWKRERRL